ncbi:MAG TPA: hypothetical protein VK612_08170, partial [Pyrinomonadaceae bacterium]|nr:hypothetical protein [Pyrinomonadaceae bacterium]
MENTTPMLRQYLEIKKSYPGTILFFRLGDFYEMFNEDALVGSRELQITLTARHKDSPNPVPMCGVPHHAAANYISKLVRKGYRVAICEQVEAAGKGIKLVKREVVRVITPGTAIDPQLVDPKESVYLASLFGSGETYGAAFIDLSTGEFQTTEVIGASAWQKIVEQVQSFAPREVLFPESLKDIVRSAFGGVPDRSLLNGLEDNEIRVNSDITLTPLSDDDFDLRSSESLLNSQLGTSELRGFGIADKYSAIRAAGACLKYIKETQKASAAHISEIKYFASSDFMVLDTVTLRNLEIVDANNENTKPTLLKVIDETITGMGGRLLRSWIMRPSIKRTEIQTRQTAVSELTDTILREKLRYLLKEVADLERLVGRLNLGNATPRDLLALNRSLGQTPDINSSLSDASSLLLQVLSENIFELPEIRK